MMIKHSFTWMGRPTALIAFLFSFWGQLTLSAAAGEVSLLSPENGAILYQPHPHFHWQRVAPDQLEDAYQIQIASRQQGKVVVDESFEVISRYVPVKALEPGEYRWRVRKAPDGVWSQLRSFEIKLPKVHTIAAGTAFPQIQETILEAAENTPAQVVFEPGEYTFGNTIKLKNVNDLTVDGGGATILYNQSSDKRNGGILYFLECANITVRNMTLREYKNPSILLDVVAADHAAQTLKLKPQEGERTDLYNVFTPGPKNHAILRFPDLENPGKSLGGISLKNPKLKLTGPDDQGVFTIHNVTAKLEEGMVGTLLKYSTSAFDINRCSNFTLANLDLLGTGAAVLGGSDNSALSILSCRFLPRKPGGLLGAQSYITGGEIGMWIEDVEISLTPDDNMACISVYSQLKEITAEGMVTLGRRLTLKAGDQLLLWDASDEAAGRTAVVEVTEVWGDKGQTISSELTDDRRAFQLKLAKTPAQLNREMKRPSDASFEGVRLFRYNPDNHDFVYRNNKIFGGSAGCMYNGTRGLIEGNDFENCRGPGIRAGYHSPNQAAGYGARNVVVKNNTVKNTGRVAITSISTANVGANIVIKNNEIIYTTENGELWNAIQIRGVPNGVVIKDNTIRSELEPDKRRSGGWIRVYDASEVETAGNQIVSEFGDVPLVKRK